MGEKKKKEKSRINKRKDKERRVNESVVCPSVHHLLLNVRILSINAVAAKAASASRFSRSREVTIAVNTYTCIDIMK